VATEIELLQKIPANTATNSSLHVAIVAGGSAVAGALVSALLSYFGIRHTVKLQSQMERQKLQATIVSAERLRWLQEIRTRLSSLYASMDMQFNLLQRPALPSDRRNRRQELDDLSRDIMVQVNVISLMLNPAKPVQERLRGALQANQGFLLAHFSQPEEAQTESSFIAYRNLKQTAFDALTEIGVETWKRIKELQ